MARRFKWWMVIGPTIGVLAVGALCYGFVTDKQRTEASSQRVTEQLREVRREWCVEPVLVVQSFIAREVALDQWQKDVRSWEEHGAPHLAVVEGECDLVPARGQVCVDIAAQDTFARGHSAELATPNEMGCSPYAWLRIRTDGQLAQNQWLRQHELGHIWFAGHTSEQLSLMHASSGSDDWRGISEAFATEDLP